MSSNNNNNDNNDKMDQQGEEPNLIMDEWQDAAMDVASDTDNNNNNVNESSNENLADDHDAFPTDIVEASESNEMSEGSGTSTSSGMGSFVDVNAVGNEGKGHNNDDDDDLTDNTNEEGSQNTDPSLVLVDREVLGEEEKHSSLNEEEVLVQVGEDTTTSGINEKQVVSGDTVQESNEQVFSTPIRSNKVIESKILDNYLEDKMASTEVQEPVVDKDSKEIAVVVEENAMSPCEPNGDKMGGQVSERNESQDNYSSFMAGKSPRSQNHRMKHIKLRQKYVSSTKSTTENSNDNSSLYQSPSNLTSASQVTTVHRNTAIPSMNSNISERSDVSSFGKGDISGSPSSEVFLKDWERRRLRNIALEAVAGSTAVSESSEATEAGKEDRPSDSGQQSQLDPFAAINGQSSSTVPETDMPETVTSSTSKDFFGDPRQLRKGNIINTESNTSSNTGMSNHPFENILPLRSENGAYIDIGRLIVVGVAGILGGVIPSVFALTTCQFVNIHKKVGYYNEILVVHAGMSSFTPMDSVFQGHSNCISYNHQYYGQQAPVFAKANATLALFCGGVSILILWLYNLTTKTTFVLWSAGKGFAIAAAVFQLLTLQFFFSSVCEDEMCRIGAGSAGSLVAACIYFLMAFEMNRNCPARRLIPGLVNALVEKKVGQSNAKGKAGQESDSFYSAPNLV